MKRNWFLSAILLACLKASPVLSSPVPATAVPAEARSTGPSAARTIDFATEIKPILAARCYDCHGPEKSKNGLRLDLRDAALAGGDSGPVIVRGKSAESLLIRYVTGENDDKIIMPPKGDRLSAVEISLLRAWIDQGATWPAEPALSTSTAQRVTPSHWAFIPPRRPSVPSVKQPQWVRNPIDAFVLARLEKEEIVPSAEADRFTLIHRLSLDLLGLLPTPGEVQAFVQDQNPGAYEHLVDRLLGSPFFGERWGRHWLDLARYADSDGYEDDKFRPDAWRYREWVIDAFNRDLAFDRFTVWQLAGDLLPNATYGQKVATGFHRMTLSNNAGAGGVKEEYRVKNVKDRLNTASTVWLGLTVGCAECHSHKYDPLSQREYYQLYSFFNNVEEVSTPAPEVAPRYRREYEEAIRSFNERIQKLQQAVRDYERDLLPARQEQWEKTGADPKQLPESIRQALAAPGPDRTPSQRSELTKYFRTLDPDYARLKAALPVGDEVGNNRPLPPSDKAMVVAENADPRKSYMQKAGDFLRNGAEVWPATPAFLAPLKPRGAQADRLDLARWIVDPENPLASRVAVNRIWQHLFGQGLVATSDNFGRKGERPSHPELLDWLATEFGRCGWSQKEIIRLIVTSASYRQRSQFRPELEGRDPNNVLLARQNRLRLEAECVRDVALCASGLLLPELGGPSFQPPLPTALAQAKELKNERFMESSTTAGRYRRGVYVNVQRTFAFPTFAAFDLGDANVCCVRRDRSNTPLQALTLLNDPVFFEAAQGLGWRVVRECRSDFAARVDYLYQLALARHPRWDEIAELEALFSEQLNLGRTHPEAARQLIGPPAPPEGMDNAEAAAWIGLARTVLNLDEFITRQ